MEHRIPQSPATLQISKLKALQLLRAATLFVKETPIFNKEIIIPKEAINTILELDSNNRNFLNFPYAFLQLGESPDRKGVIVSLNKLADESLEKIAGRSFEEVKALGDHAYNVVFGAAVMEQQQAAAWPPSSMPSRP